MIMGNHEHYGMNIADTPGVIHEFLHRYAKNTTLLDNDFRKEYGFMFIGSTLWTCYGAPNPIQEAKIANAMNDCRLIRIYDGKAFCGERPITPTDIHKIHKKNKYAIYRILNNKNHKDIPKILMTHHAPSWHSATYSDYPSSDLDFAYYTNLEKAFAKKYRVKLAIHGHTHKSCIYKLHATVVTSNQRGYKGSEACAKDFNPRDGDIELEQLLLNEQIAPDPRFTEGPATVGKILPNAN